MADVGAGSVRDKAARWLTKDPDAATRWQLQELLDAGNEKALKQAFGSRMEFGTAGLRGLMGVGPNNMNRLVIRETTAGLADFLLEARLEPGARQRVVIAYDGRHGSRDFAHDAAGVLAAKDLDVFLYDTTAPTPLGAFAVKALGTAAGIVVTASHNPPEYNGYKVYRHGGAQINDPVDGQISEKIIAVAGRDEGPACMTFDEGRLSGRITMLGQDMFNRYIDAVIEGVPTLAAGQGDDDASQRARFSIAYTPLHGVGAPIAEKLFKRLGFMSTFTVPEQREPDGDFPTVEFPNPEEKGATDLLIALADKHKAPLAIANDPDADRLCICARDSKGKMRQMTGDQLGSLLGDALITQALDNDGAVAKDLAVRCTIVSSRILARIARSKGVEHRETLTGFKWLGPAAQRVTESGRRFVFAYEEALGYMVSDVVLDKDGLSGLVAIAQLAYALHRQGKTVWDQLEDIHRRVGLSITMQRTIKLQPGTSGDGIMTRLRAEKRSETGSYTIALTDDLLDRPRLSQAGPEDIPRNDVLRYFVSTSDASASQSKEEIELSQPRIIVRPSGTEPKVKIYCEILSSIRKGEAYEAANQRATKELTEIVDAFHSWMSPPSASGGKAQSEPGASSAKTTTARAASSQDSLLRRLFKTFPLVTNGTNLAQAPAPSECPAKPTLYVAPAHPSKKGGRSTQKWASRDPVCLYWQTNLALRGVDFGVVHIEQDYTAETYQGEGFSKVPVLLDVDGTIVTHKHLHRWADAVSPWSKASEALSSSPEAQAFLSLLQGPLLAGVLLELALLPEPQHKDRAEQPFFVRQLLHSLDAERKRELASHIAALVHYSPTSRMPGWATSVHGMLGSSSIAFTGTGSLATSAEEEEAEAQARAVHVDVSKLDHDAIRREACLAIDAIATLKEDGRGWLLVDSPTTLDAHLFAELHTLLSLPIVDAETLTDKEALATRRHLEQTAPHLVSWSRNMWRNIAQPRGG